MSFVDVCRLADIPEVGALAVKVDGLPVAVVRAGDGNVYAIEDICSHAEVSLSEGEVDGCTLECWLHGSRFDLRNGEPTGLPATEPVAVYPVRIEGDGDDAVVLVDVTIRAA
ncbi:MAG: non-heme iron oxygenase ferredoxin subunit [Candidatus Nanopelagicales bacterium]